MIGEAPITLDGSNNRLVLYKTGRAKDDVSTKDAPGGEFNQPTRTVTTKKFVGGLVFAKMMNNGPDEPFERGLLYSDCGVGTDPPNIRGEWRAEKVTESATIYEDGAPAADTDAVETDRLLKVCLRLDAHPGVTKCFVSQIPEGKTDRVKSIALYDGENLDTVIDLDKLPDSQSAVGIDTTGVLFAASDFIDVEQLCNLFSNP